MDDNSIKTEKVHKEIDLIQSCISRMSKNSFLIKGWVITLIGIVFAMMPKGDPVALFYACILLIFAVIGFWYLDAYYLQIETRYRKLYELVIVLRQAGNTYRLYDLNPNRFKNEVGGIFNFIFSRTLVIFYISPVILLGICAIHNSQYLR